MKRREFITLLGGAAAWPLAVHAQQARLPNVIISATEFSGPGTLNARSSVISAGELFSSRCSLTFC
jgi:hypothetical protein